MDLPKYISQFDYVRGIAVLVVMLFHASHDVTSFPMARYVEFGWAGVDLFFVLSGFLITGILLSTRDHNRYFVNFYAKRILRIWPLYFALLGVMFMVVPLVVQRWTAGAMSTAKPSWPFFLLVQNLAIRHAVTGPLGSVWSLAIEEQFYFVWPLLVWLLPRRSIQWVVVAIILASPLLRLFLTLKHVHVAMYFNTFTRLDGLAIGSLLAVCLPAMQTTTVKRCALTVLPVALLGSIVFTQPWIRFSLVAVAAGCLVTLSLFGPPAIRFLGFTGRISYGLYLLHLGIFGVATKPELRSHYPMAPALNDITYLIVGFLLSYAVASLSWYCFESQILRARKYFISVPPQRYFEPISSTRSSMHPNQQGAMRT